MTGGQRAAVWAARIVHAYRAELARLNPPSDPAERGTTGAVTQVNTAIPPAAYRTGRVATPTALHGAGFTAAKRAPDD